MSTQCFAPEFKEEAVRRVIDRKYSVAEVSARLGVLAHSLCKWIKAVALNKTENQAGNVMKATRTE